MPSTDYSWFAQQLQTFINRRSMPQPSHRFVLFSTALSGGHIVIDLLRRMTDVRYGSLPPTWRLEPLLERRHFFPLRHIQRHAAVCSHYLFGFKLSATDLMVTHAMGEPHRFVELLHGQGYKLVYLRRRDLMRHSIAILKAQRPKSRRIDPQALLATLQRLDHHRIAEAAIIAQVPHLTITYEADLLDPNVHNVTAQRLYRFLSLQPRRPVNDSMKLVHQHISDLVDNYGEIYDTLQQSDYAYVLTEASAKLAI